MKNKNILLLLKISTILGLSIFVSLVIVGVLLGIFFPNIEQHTIDVISYVSWALIFFFGIITIILMIFASKFLTTKKLIKQKFNASSSFYNDISSKLIQRCYTISTENFSYGTIYIFKKEKFTRQEFIVVVDTLYEADSWGEFFKAYYSCLSNLIVEKAYTSNIFVISVLGVPKSNTSLIRQMNKFSAQNLKYSIINMLVCFDDKRLVYHNLSDGFAHVRHKKQVKKVLTFLKSVESNTKSAQKA